MWSSTGIHTRSPVVLADFEDCLKHCEVVKITFCKTNYLIINLKKTKTEALLFGTGKKLSKVCGGLNVFLEAHLLILQQDINTLAQQ